jgi:hypothetical protein
MGIVEWLAAGTASHFFFAPFKFMLASDLSLAFIE